MLQEHICLFVDLSMSKVGFICSTDDFMEFILESKTVGKRFIIFNQITHRFDRDPEVIILRMQKEA